MHHDIMLRLTSATAMVVAAGIISFSHHAYAQQDTGYDEANDARYYNQISLTTLIDMPVSVASGRAERTSDAPGAVTAYDKKDLGIFGYFTIADLADITPGYSSQTERTDNVSLETRGATSANNEKHLILLDDIPLTNIRSNSVSVQFEIPLLLAQQVEFLRGPASALYGTGAFNGVVNIIPQSLPAPGYSLNVLTKMGMESGTPKDISQKPGEFFVHRNEIGGLVYSRLLMANAIARTTRSELQLNYSFYDRTPSLEKGYYRSEKTGSIDTTQPGNYFRNNGIKQFFRLQSRITAGPLEGAGMGLVAYFHQGGFGASWGFNTAIPRNLELFKPNIQRGATFIPYLRFDRAIGRTMGLNMYLKANNNHDQGSQVVSNQLFGYSGLSNGLEFKGKYRYDIFDMLQIIAGVNLDVRGSDSSHTYTQTTYGIEKMGSLDFTRQYNYIAFTYAAFLQVRGVLPVLNDLIITAGLRSDNGFHQGRSEFERRAYHQLSPRVAMVLKIMDYLNAKLMYSTALQPPSALAISYNIEKQPLIDAHNRLNPSKPVYLQHLDAEMIHSIEGNLTFSMNTIFASVTGFFTVVDKPIQYKILSPLGFYYQNAGYNTFSRGAEVEVRWAPLNRLRFWASSSYTKTWADYARGDVLPNNRNVLRDTTVFNIVEDIPLGKTYLGVNYRTRFGMSLFAIVKDIWAVVRTADVRGGPGADFDPGYWLVDIKVEQPLARSITLEAGISNLLNTQYYFGHGLYPGANRVVSLSLKSEF
jgi:outer membrane receptor for ferrienterochelin and colicins